MCVKIVKKKPPSYSALLSTIFNSDDTSTTIKCPKNHSPAAFHFPVA